MKTIKSILILLPAVIFVLAFSTTKAQTAIEYLNQVPKFKDLVSACSEEILTKYIEDIGNLKSKVAEDAESRGNAMDEYMEGNKGNMEDAMMKQAADRSGMSVEEMQKLKKKGDMTDAEKNPLKNRGRSLLN